MVKHLFLACRNFDEVYLECKCNEILKRRMTEMSSHNKYTKNGKEMLTPPGRIYNVAVKNSKYDNRITK